MKNFLSVSILVVLVAALVGACHTPPKYPDEPNISYKNVERYHFTENGRPKDSLVIVTRFEDGDGDLGLTDADNEPPFNPATQEYPQQGEYFYNYFIRLYIKRNDQFQLYQFPSAGGLNGRFFPLAPDGRVGTLEGDLKYGFIMRPNRDFAIGDVVKFEVYIVDKKTHKSNIIETEEITLFK